MCSGTSSGADDVGSSGVDPHGHVATPDAVVVVVLVVLDVLVLLRLVLLARDFVVRDGFLVVVLVTVVVRVAVVVDLAARTTSVVDASRPPFGALCVAVTVYCPASTDGRKRAAKLPSLLAVTVATVAPFSVIATAEHCRDEQKPSPNAVVASPLSTGFGATLSCAFVLLIAASALAVGTRSNARRCTTATAKGRLAGLMA